MLLAAASYSTDRHESGVSFYHATVSEEKQIGRFPKMSSHSFETSKSGGINNINNTYDGRSAPLTLPLHSSSLPRSNFSSLILSFSIRVNLSDIRVNYCYTKFDNGRCLAPKPQNTSKAACCCTGMPGQGWGDPCEICPSKGEGRHSSYHTDKNTRTIPTYANSCTQLCILLNGISLHNSWLQRGIFVFVPMRDINGGQMTTRKVFV